MIAMVAALAEENRVIGKDNKLPWHLPEELAHFKALTMGKPLVMGRKTHESIGRPLPGRRNIVLTRGEAPAGCERAGSVEEAVQMCADVPEVMVIGGEEVYRQFLPLAGRQYLTMVAGHYEGDAFYPEFDPREWRELECSERSGYKHVTLERIPS